MNNFYTKKILIVDDNIINREMVKKILAKLGVSPVSASSGEEALEILKKEPDFDIVLLDINMPGMRGTEFARIIRNMDNKKLREIHVTALTASERPEQIKEILDSGINSCIIKPATPQNLKEIIDNTGKEVSKKINSETSKDSSLELEIDMEQGMFLFADNEQLFKKFLKKFYENYSDYMDKIIYFKENNDHENLAFAIHTLKGTSSQICAVNLNRETVELEKKIENKTFTNQDIKNLGNRLNTTMNAINSILNIK